MTLGRLIVRLTVCGGLASPGPWRHCVGAHAILLHNILDVWSLDCLMPYWTIAFLLPDCFSWPLDCQWDLRIWPEKQESHPAVDVAGLGSSVVASLLCYKQLTYRSGHLLLNNLKSYVIVRG